MSRSTPWVSLAVGLALCLASVVPLGAAAQSDVDDEGSPAAAASLPELEGLAWHRSIELRGPQFQESLSDAEVTDWAKLLDGAGATFDELEYTYQAAFDPSALPDLGGLATVRVAGADTDVLRSVVVQDIVDQVVGLGHPAPEIEEAAIGGKDVAVVRLPSGVGFEDAVVYADGHIAYVFLMAEDLVASALEQLP